MIADMISSKNLHPVVAELFIRGRELKFFFDVHDTIIHATAEGRKTKHSSIIKIRSRSELKQIDINHSF